MGKPLMIGSFGVSDGAPGAKAQWITAAYGALATTFTNIGAAIEDGTGTAAMTTSPDVQAAWNGAVTQSSLYTAPTPNLPTGPLVPKPGTSMLGAMLVKGNHTSEPAAWNSLEASSGGHVNVAQMIYNWGDTVPSWRESYAISQGRTPMISWGGTSTTEIASGKDDTYIRSTATAIKALGGQVFLRWFWEMDGSYFAPQTGTPAEFKAAWAHIHGIFASIGATNVVWVWCPTGYGFTTGAAQTFYPGDSLVDWVAADGFNPYPVVGGSSPTSFASLFTAFNAWGTSIGKPMMIGATGVMEASDPMAKANWIRNMARTIQVLDPGIRAICYLDKPSGWYPDPSLTLHWELGSSTNAMQAWGAVARAHVRQRPVTTPSKARAGRPNNATPARACCRLRFRMSRCMRARSAAVIDVAPRQEFTAVMAGAIG